MEYDKNSFLAGISVGVTLKGWSSSAAGINTAGSAITLADFTPVVRVFSSLSSVEHSLAINLADYMED